MLPSQFRFKNLLVVFCISSMAQFAVATESENMPQQELPQDNQSQADQTSSCACSHGEDCSCPNAPHSCNQNVSGHAHHNREWGKPRHGGGGGPVLKTTQFKNDKLKSTFEANGFNVPSSPLIFYGGKGFGQKANGVRMGGGGYGSSFKETNGSSIAEVSLGYGGFIIGKEYPINDSFQVIPQVLLGGAGYTLNIFSQTANGRLEWSGLAMEPGIEVSYQAKEWLHLTMEASYFLLFAETKQTVGDKLDAEFPKSFANLSIGVLFGRF